MDNTGKTTYAFDKLQMYFGEDYKISEGIVISQPSIGDIMRYGEDKFYEMLNPFIINPTSMRVALWQQNIDWTEISDYELFYQLILQLKPTPDKTRMLFGDLDFSKFNLYERRNEVDGEIVKDIVLLNQEQEVIIDEEVYAHISCYLRTMFNIFPKVERAKGKTTKRWMIEEDIENSKNKVQTLFVLLKFEECFIYDFIVITENMVMIFKFRKPLGISNKSVVIIGCNGV